MSRAVGRSSGSSFMQSLMSSVMSAGHCAGTCHRRDHVRTGVKVHVGFMAQHVNQHDHSTHELRMFSGYLVDLPDHVFTESGSLALSSHARPPHTTHALVQSPAVGECGCVTQLAATCRMHRGARVLRSRSCGRRRRHTCNKRVTLGSKRRPRVAASPVTISHRMTPKL